MWGEIVKNPNTHVMCPLLVYSKISNLVFQASIADPTTTHYCLDMFLMQPSLDGAWIFEMYKKCKCKLIIWPFHSSITIHTFELLPMHLEYLSQRASNLYLPHHTISVTEHTTATKKANPHKIHLITTAKCTAVYYLTLTKKSTLLWLFKKI